VPSTHTACVETHSSADADIQRAFCTTSSREYLTLDYFPEGPAIEEFARATRGLVLRNRAVRLVSSVTLAEAQSSDTPHRACKKFRERAQVPTQDVGLHRTIPASVQGNPAAYVFMSVLTPRLILGGRQSQSNG
jgi:hypothetical protein